MMKENTKGLPSEPKWKVRRSLFQAMVFTLFFLLCRGLTAIFVRFMGHPCLITTSGGGGGGFLNNFSPFRGLATSDTSSAIVSTSTNDAYYHHGHPQSAKEFFLQSFLGGGVGVGVGGSSLLPGGTIDTSGTSHSIPLLLAGADGDAGEEEGDPRPIFILHVGLPKTGTTFLQCSLCSDPNLTVPILAADDFVYIGTCPYVDCLMEEPTAPEDEYNDLYLKHGYDEFFLNPEWVEEEGGHGLGPVPHTPGMAEAHVPKKKIPKLNPTFLDHLERVRLLGDQNALLVFEGCHAFSARYVRSLASLLNPNWNVHVVVSYRPLYDWLPSKYNSINKPSRRPTARVWPGQQVYSTDDANDEEGGDVNVNVTGAPLPPFDLNHRGAFSEWVNDLQSTEQHPAETVRNNYALHFENVHVLPLHRLPSAKRQGKQQKTQHQARRADPLLEFFFCNVLRYATPHTCAAIRSSAIGGNLSYGVRNPSYPFNCDMLAVEAYQQGLFRVDVDNADDVRRLRRERVTVLVARQQLKWNQTLNSFEHTVCLPNSTLDRLEHLSLTLEEKLFRSEWLPRRDERAHHEGFARALTVDRKFCHIDAKKTLEQDKRWRDFFLSLNIIYVDDNSEQQRDSIDDIFFDDELDEEEDEEEEADNENVGDDEDEEESNEDVSSKGLDEDEGSGEEEDDDDAEQVQKESGGGGGGGIDEIEDESGGGLDDSESGDGEGAAESTE